jgi:glycosyltransferase involved in cell wall biosynthesis
VARLTSRLTARTIVHTQADLGRLAGWRDGAVVIPHGEYGGLASRGGSADRAQARAALGIPELAPATLMFGQLRTDKGLPDLVEAVRRLPSLHLLIGGQDLGGLAEVRDELATAGLEGRVTLREGFLDMREAATLFAAADTVALPYRTASQSGVLLLAYGFARPVVVYPRGGMVEAVIDGETGWICTAADVDALTRALLASIEAGPEECLRRGERGRALARERYAWPAVAGLTTEVYDDVIARS